MSSPSNPPSPFAGRARVAGLAADSVFALRTDAVLSTAALVPIASIDPNPRNPRGAIVHDEAFAELVASIREHGLLQPILIRRDGVRRILIAGHRRLAAVQQIAAEAPDDTRWRKILAVERLVDEDQAFILALAENLHRENLPPPEEAAALELLEQQLGSLQAVADAIKRSKAYVSRRIRTYQDSVLAAAVLDGGLAPTTAQEFLPIKDTGHRQVLVQDALREGWDAPTARAAVRVRCESQQQAQASSQVPARCESQQRPDTATGARAAAARSRAVVRQVQRLRRVLEDGSVASLSAAAIHELRALAGYLGDALSEVPLEAPSRHETRPRR